MTRAAVYARISTDTEDTGLGVARQTEDCRREIERRGWTLANTYTDNDVSATRSRVRPQYERLLTDIRNGLVDALVVWDVDRLTRTPRELEDIIDLADKQGLQLASCGGEIDLATPQGRLTARLKGSVARHESDQMSKRLKRKFDERAKDGRPHGLVAFGYQRVDGQDIIDPAEAAIIRSTSEGLLRGETLRSLVGALNATGSRTPRGGIWSSTLLRQIMLRDRNAGLRRHRGQVVGKAMWEPIYDEDTHTRVVTLLTDPNRTTNKGATRVHLLSGLALCGLCGAKVRVTVGKKAGVPRSPGYQCGECLKIRRLQSAVDTYVTVVMVERLKQADIVTALAEGDPERARASKERAAALEARMAQAADRFADGAITADQLARITGKLRPQIEAEKAEIAAASPVDGVLDLAGPDAEARWESASLAVRRAVIDTLAVVTILPIGRGGRFDPDSVAIRWREPV